MKTKKLIKSAIAVTCGAMVLASCSKKDDFGSVDMKQMQNEVYASAFTQEFGTPASDQDWGFGKFNMINVTVLEGSPRYMGDATFARTRGVAQSVTEVSPTKYNTEADFLKQETATAYFFLRIDNNIVVQELKGVQGNPANEYYPKPGLNLGNGVTDKQYNTDNQGSLNMAEYKKLALIKNTAGVTFATANDPIPTSIFSKMPTFEDMAKHIPDAEKIKIAEKLEDFNSENYKIFWYVVKWQASDKVVHVDGILVPKNQITVNIPEYKKRIIVEDLKGNIDATTKVSGSDFDFNDVVFDAVTWNREGKNYLKIILRAAGGTLPIYVNGVEIHEGVGYMFNTSKNPDYTFGKVLFDGEIGVAAETFDFNSIPVVVEVNGERVAAGSNIGEAPEKIAVGIDYKWCEEYTNIKQTYPKFVRYVSDKTFTGWYKN
jgi:hypothetical protein